MAGISISVELQEATARQALRDMLARMGDLRPFYKGVGEILLNSARERFDSQSGPNGAPWAPLKPATVRARIKKNQLPLMILQSNTNGKNSSLKASLNAIPSDKDVRVGSPVLWAAIHQLGGTINKDAGSRYMVGRRFAKRDKEGGNDVAIKAHTIRIPARPYIGVSDLDQERILEAAEEWLRL
ncbi:phage virion morphogenesis protein [Rhodobacter viridis]|uniref:Phage virion morphogenesis protein n=1 Tax=Rhodobacter viridis TaxID=1054202 RepID=A0A318U1D3_9RHOB|nr:phage virion morphogenesis protein [Rhodobacter viridis]PYF08235.1 phage virion morphogenesis protein [Rhodobacter viridis]